MSGLLAVLIFLVAILYAAVGSGGGTGYLAVMGIAGVAPEVMRPAALALNVLVAGIGTWKYAGAGHFSGRVFWPVAVASIPLAYLGGSLALPAAVYRPLLGIVLLYAAWRLVRASRQAAEEDDQQREARPALPVWLAILLGGAIGFVSGLMGIGGGIFLSPLLILRGWVDTRRALGVTAAFVLVNSLAGLAGFVTAVAMPPAAIWLWLAAAGAGGWIGAEYGSRRLNPIMLQRLLALVLVVGGSRLILAAWGI